MTLAVDTSALMAVLLGEPDATIYASVLSEHAGDISISAATLVESTIVALAKQGEPARHDLETLLRVLDVETVAVDAGQAQLAARAWQRFGKGRHPASLNFGDCFSYAVAKGNGAALLFKGDDFTQTDIASAL